MLAVVQESFDPDNVLLVKMSSGLSIPETRRKPFNKNKYIWALFWSSPDQPYILDIFYMVLPQFDP